MTRLVVIRGLPGSGKTTLATTKYETYKHYEHDMWFEKEYGYMKFSFDDLPKAQEWCQSRVRKSLEEGHNTVVANVFSNIKSMRPYLDMCLLLNLPFKVVETTGNFKSLHPVSKEAMASMRRNWQAYP